MGFYLRKGFGFGPLRLNLSRSGLGASVGIKGFRIGLGPRGAYLHAGRGGLYYRQSLGHLGAHPSPANEPVGQVADALQPIESGDVGEMLNADSADLLAELNRVANRMDLAPLTGLLVAAALVAEWFVPVIPLWGLVGTAILGVALVVLARHKDVTNGTLVLQYEVEGAAADRFKSLKTAFAEFAACQGVWHVRAAGETDDWKRNAGANVIVERGAIRPALGKPRRVEMNIEVPALLAGRQRVYFLPDQLLVFDGNQVGAVRYAELRATTVATHFNEAGQVPQDAQQVGTTWRYVNKKGGPDRRFNDNREIPILLYGELHLESDSGLREHFECSRPSVVEGFVRALEQMAKPLES